MPIPNRTLGVATAMLTKSFEDVYRKLYGRVAEAILVETVTGVSPFAVPSHRRRARVDDGVRPEHHGNDRRLSQPRGEA